jgi:hypothetical protein
MVEGGKKAARSSPRLFSPSVSSTMVVIRPGSAAACWMMRL